MIKKIPNPKKQFLTSVDVDKTAFLNEQNTIKKYRRRIRLSKLANNVDEISKYKLRKYFIFH